MAFIYILKFCEHIIFKNYNLKFLTRTFSFGHNELIENRLPSRPETHTPCLKQLEKETYGKYMVLDIGQQIAQDHMTPDRREINSARLMFLPVYSHR